jgi:ubiquinone/menaquinone biosynthesis C-methylase UbiE
LEFTRNAFRVLPPVEDPSILDIGCGSGVQTIELANLCNGHITAIDIDVGALEALRKKVEDQGFSNRIDAIELSMLELNRLGKNFDIIWAEGSIFVVGFETGIRDWKVLLVDNGCLVVHDEDTDISTKLKVIERHKYKIIRQFKISHDEWWKRYYEPLVNFLEQESLDSVNEESLRTEIDRFKKTKMGSVFFVMQKK